MEAWQRKHVLRHLPELIEQTKVNTITEAILLREEVIAKIDLEHVEAERQRHGNQAAVKLLLDLLITRKDSYKALGRTAFKTKQCGAFNILLKGLVYHILKQNNIELEKQTIEEIIQHESRKEEALTFFLTKIDKPTLLEESWIPSLRGPIYISRHISNRVKLNPEIFRQDFPDVFVFSGLSRTELTKLAHPNQTSTSREVILNGNTTERFILLEHQDDWDNLQSVCSITDLKSSPTSSSNRPVHHVWFDSISKDYILQQSTQPSEVVSRHVAPTLRDKSLYVPEEEFIDHIIHKENNRPVCVCDTPGMGKTWLLENLARNIQILEPGHIVAVVNLPQFARQMKSHLERSSIEEVEDIYVVMSYLCPLRLTSLILKNAVNTEKIHLDLLLDGFDEIPTKLVDPTKRFFRTLSKTMDNVRLLITSRPHMRKDLEATFEAFACDILPFTEKNQIDYLVGMWQKSAKSQHGELEEEKLTIFARSCLKNLKKSLTKKEGDLMGIPLQCFLVATVNLKNAQMYCCRDSVFNADQFVSATSMYDMYTTCVRMGIQKGVEYYEHNQPAIPKWRQKQGDGEARRHMKSVALKSFHVWKALQLLYPDLAEDYFQNENLSEREMSSEIWACGLLQHSRDEEKDVAMISFIHRTIAEYLVAELFADIFIGRHKFSKESILIKYLTAFVKDVLTIEKHSRAMVVNSRMKSLSFDTYNFSQTVIVSFVNSYLGVENIAATPLTVAKVGLNLLGDQLHSILCATISSGHVNIIRFLKQFLIEAITRNVIRQEELRKQLSYESPVNNETFTTKQHFISTCRYLCPAASTSNVQVVKEVYNLFQECLHENLDDIWSKVDYDVETPLHISVRRRDYSLVEFFVGRICRQQRDLIRLCIRYTTHLSADELQSTMDICSLLVENCSTILHEVEDILLEEVHLKLVKLILRQINTSLLRKNIVTDLVEKIDQNDFCELCRFLICDIKAFHLFRPKLLQWADPLPKLIGYVNETTIRYILQVPGLVTDYLDENGNSLILITICMSGDVGVIQALAENGVDINLTNYKCEGCLHLAAKTRNFAVVKYLVSKGLSLENGDAEGNTALHHAVYNLEMVAYLVSLNVNVLAVNKNGNNIAHLAAKGRKGDKVLNFLLELNNANNIFSSQNAMGKTPLDLLFTNDFPQIKNIELLLNLPEIENLTKKVHTLFLHAIKRGQSVKVLQALKNKGANPFSVNGAGENALHLAVDMDNLDLIQYLVSIGVDLECYDKYGRTPLLLAAHHKNMHILKYLIVNKANLHVVDNAGRNIVHRLLCDASLKVFSATEAVQYLITLPRGVDLLRSRNKEGKTPLHELLSMSNVTPCLSIALVDLILRKCKLDINATDNDGNTMFLTTASLYNCVRYLKHLKEHGANHNLVNNDGNNALHVSIYSSKGDKIETCKYLLKIGCNPNHVNNKGLTPLQLWDELQEIIVAYT